MRLISVYDNISVDKIDLDDYVSKESLFNTIEGLEDIYDDSYYDKINCMYKYFYKELVENFGEEEALITLLNYIKINEVKNIKIKEFSKSDIFCLYSSLV